MVRIYHCHPVVEVPTVVLLCLFEGLVAGLLRPRPSRKQIEQSSSSGKFRERHNRCNRYIFEKGQRLCRFICESFVLWDIESLHH